MTDQPVAVSCLNGEIQVGDRVAVAISQGRYGGGMRLGTVEEILSVRAIRVRVEKSSGSTGQQLKKDDEGHYYYVERPYSKTFEDLDRVVKLAPPVPEWLHIPSEVSA